MLRFFKLGPLQSSRVGIFPATFNPVTRAHLALAEAAREQYELDQIVFLLPESFPHKPYAEASFEDRVKMLQAALAEDPAAAIASSPGGLFFEIARAFRAECGPGADLYVLCGRDAAERAVNWDYGDGPPFREQLREFTMLVAPREGDYEPPADYKERIQPIRLPASYDEVSASAVRQAVAAGRPWRHLAPVAVAEYIETHGLYKSPRPPTQP